MAAGRFLQAGGTEGWEADLASSTAEGVGGFHSHSHNQSKGMPSRDLDHIVRTQTQAE